MKVRIRFVLDKGDRQHERLVLRVLRSGNIGDYLLIRTVYEDDQVTTEVKNTFWFPDEQVNAGDNVVVYSKRGTTRKKLLGDGRTAHFFYWGQESSLWEDEGVAPVLLYVPEWASMAPEELVESA